MVSATALIPQQTPKSLRETEFSSGTPWEEKKNSYSSPRATASRMLERSSMNIARSYRTSNLQSSEPNPDTRNLTPESARSSHAAITLTSYSSRSSDNILDDTVGGASSSA